jgi:hypothetical protein
VIEYQYKNAKKRVMVIKETVKGKTVRKNKKPVKMTKQAKIPKKPEKSTPIKKSQISVEPSVNKNTPKNKKTVKPPEKTAAVKKLEKKTVSIVKNIPNSIQEELLPLPEKPIERIDLSLPEGSVYKQTGHRRPLIVFPK